MRATEMFGFLESVKEFSLEKVQIRSRTFDETRYRLLNIFRKLSDSDEEEDQLIARTLRSELSRWLTAPVSFAERIPVFSRLFIDLTRIAARWGNDFAQLVDQSSKVIAALADAPNPMTVCLTETLHELRRCKCSTLIYCDRSASQEYLSVLSATEVGGGDTPRMIHSLSEYRQCEPADVLVKVGPLRYRGWGSVPSAILTAPHFQKILNITWSGLGDDEAFGSELNSLLVATLPEPERTEELLRQTKTGLNWVRSERAWRDGEPFYSELPELDAFRVFAEVRKKQQLNDVVLVEVGTSEGIYLSPNSLQLTIDPKSEDPVKYESVAESVLPGLLLVIPAVEGTGLVDPKADDGYYSRQWKARLMAELKASSSLLIGTLRSEGVMLDGLPEALERWCQPATTVIHAPKKPEHFKALIKVLEKDWLGPAGPRMRAPWWQYAWGEVMKSRGEAIQIGFLEHQEIGETLLNSLRRLSRTIVAEVLASKRNVYPIEYPIPAGESVTGTFRCFEIQRILEGYRVPGDLVGTFARLDEASEWQG